MIIKNEEKLATEQFKIQETASKAYANEVRCAFKYVASHFYLTCFSSMIILPVS